MSELTTETFLEQFKDIQEKGLEIVKTKNNDYGFSFIQDGYEGTLIRITDKINRLRTLSSGVKNNVSDENIKDTLIDLQNYSVIALICLNNNLHSPLLKEKQK